MAKQRKCFLANFAEKSQILAIIKEKDWSIKAELTERAVAP
ncbi:hypothetical protein [Segatella buccae]|jgi:hypothetical protein|nr:hypothetical protein [Segatella buccae]